MKNRLMGVTGLTGVGKDYLVTAANADSKINTVNLGSMIGEILSIDRDAMMEAASKDRIREAQLAAYRRVVDEQPLIVTCHAIRPTEDGSLGFDEEMENVFDPMVYAFVTAPADLIQERVAKRNQTGERKSIELSLSQIDEEQLEKLELTQALARHLRTKLIVLENVDENYVANVALLRAEINRILQ